MKVDVTLSIRGKDVPIDKVPDKGVQAALTKMGNDLGKQLDPVRCPTHDQGPTNVRVRVQSNGNADLRYDSCCQELVAAIQRATG